MRFYVALCVGVVSFLLPTCVDFYFDVWDVWANLIFAFLAFVLTLAFLWTGDEGND